MLGVYNRNKGNSIAYLVFAIAISVTCTFSLLSVSEKNGFSNHWQTIGAVASESRFDKVKAAVSKQHLDSGSCLLLVSLPLFTGSKASKKKRPKFIVCCGSPPKSRRTLLETLSS
jgi:hypothetical protein